MVLKCRIVNGYEQINVLFLEVEGHFYCLIEFTRINHFLIDRILSIITVLNMRIPPINVWPSGTSDSTK